MVNKNRIATLLSSGLSNMQVASIVGLTPARISQLKAEDAEFQLLLAEYEALAEKDDAEEVAIGAKYLTLEHSLVDRITSLAETSDMREAVLGLKAVQDRKAAKVLHNAPVTGNGNTINNITLHLPQHILSQHTPVIDITPNREIVSIDNKNLTPLNSNAVTKLFKGMKNIQNNIESKNMGEYNDPTTDTDSSNVSNTTKGSSLKEALSKATSSKDTAKHNTNRKQSKKVEPSGVEESFLSSSRSFASI